MLELLSIAPLVTEPVTIFLIVLVIILLAPILLNKLKIPHIIGMIVAGVIIGPYGFNVLDRDSSFAIFGQVGLLYLMFLAGLEIDMFHLRLNMRRGMLFGILTLIVPLAMGVLSSVYILGLDWTTSLLLGAMYASHTLLSYPIVARFGVTKAPAVLISIVGTIIAVIGALLVIAGTINVRMTGYFDSLAMLRLLIMMALYVAAVIFFYPRLTKWFFRHYGEKVTQYVYVLTLVFLSSWFAECIGLEPVLGAFLAGLVLNRYIPASSPVMVSIEFVGNALFIPYFLISVGMMINMHVVFQWSTLRIAGIMLVISFLSKWIPAFTAQKINRLTSSSRRVMFGLTTAHTAVALAVVTLGHRMGMFDDNILNATITVILVTCAAAPMLTAWGAPTLKIEMMKDEENQRGLMGTANAGRLRVNNTLIPVANDITARALVELAILMRNERGRHEIYALHVRNDNSRSARRQCEETLRVAVKTGAASDVKIKTLDRYDLNIVTGVLNVIEERDITEVIMGLHRRATFVDSFFGMKVEQLLRSTNKMIIISRTFIPLNTVTRIVVLVPPKAQYETGFSRWVRAIARLTRQLGCRAVFCCPTDIQPLIRGVLYQANYQVRCEFQTIEDWDDFLTMSNNVKDEDLFVAIGARPSSVSFSNDIAQMPQFLQRYFRHNNILVIYPEQFGEETPLTGFADPLQADVNTTQAPWLRRLRRLLNRG
ncbi:MAG: cation:proton antiporter [Muribaculaceae bacterium]|nr:cation:proton antiporter [Muribaculaceae bacterium]